ncbi:hypothetical protein BD311DRAFT_763868 [Dichomitus squalens]|uniref:Uncharacterized protein n=1 Tax=Dichomitus squalens TaxID=114155 RepID=A0A4Q9MGA4_9APHY|nr:hypothetical protein BD311DRAFT_763868 [Dichomitus squalens]
MRAERAYNSINGLSFCQPCPEPSLAKPPPLDTTFASLLYHPLQHASSTKCLLGSDFVSREKRAIATNV